MPDDDTDLRNRYAEALIARIKASVIIDPIRRPGTVGQPLAATEHDLADSVMAVRDGELSRLRNRITALEANGSELLARAEQAEAELTEIRRVTDSPADEEMPTDPAELREMWDFINRQTRWQHHMAQTFFRGRHRALRRAKAAEIEREALAADLALHVDCRTDISIGDALRLIRGEESNADAPSPVTAATEAHGETTEAQEG